MELIRRIRVAEARISRMPDGMSRGRLASELGEIQMRVFGLTAGTESHLDGAMGQLERLEEQLKLEASVNER